MVHSLTTGNLRLFAQLALGHLLHLVPRDGAVHVHGGLVGLVAEEILYPLGSESLGLEPSGDGVAEDVRVEMDEAGIGVVNTGFLSRLLYDMVDDAGRKGFVLVGQEHWPFLTWAGVVDEVREVLLVNDGDDTGLASLALAHLHSLPVKVNVSHVQVNQLLAAQAEPI